MMLRGSSVRQGLSELIGATVICIGISLFFLLSASLASLSSLFRCSVISSFCLEKKVAVITARLWLFFFRLLDGFYYLAGVVHHLSRDTTSKECAGLSERRRFQYLGLPPEYYERVFLVSR
ncbi:hypothetical protein BOTBODRAFT_510344 [Botryobasidium botryosum FD-172 SS1]|uniref:Uncharacterized protein n=1 Tax=Botryobasidium botryosum (strain FD-172 SS1) TaxID=930990 RepID=A0A067N2L1_BOTB1|nr:hypothetical protein BOTBODRAFT_510344 [Botryobasidium botryosum FD-172 SS1]